MTRVNALIVFSLFLVGACSKPGPLNDSADVAAITKTANDWIRYYEAGDLERLMTLYEEDAIVALHGKPALRGKEAIRNFFAPGIGKAEVDFKIDIEEIDVHGDTAHFLSKYWLTAISPDSGEVYMDAGRSLLIYKRAADGAWKLYLDIDQATPDVSFPSPSIENTDPTTAL